MATLVTVTVQSSGGDYTSLSAAESGQQAIRADLVTRDEQLDIACYAFEDTTQVVFDGFTTDATRYLRVYAPPGQRHSGKWDTTKYRLVVNVGDSSAFRVLDNDFRMDGLQVYNTSTAAGAVAFSSDTSTSGTLYAINSIYRCAPGGAAGTRHAFNPRVGTLYARNCIAWGALSDNGLSVGFRDNLWSGTNGYVYNCTAYNCSRGFHKQDHGSNFYVKNCLAANCTLSFPATWNWPSGSDYNACDTALTTTGNGGNNDPPGANSRVSQTFSFVDAATGDFHLLSTDAGAKDFGTDLSGDADQAFSDDIDYETRSGSWDIGADEYVAAGGGGSNAKLVKTYLG